MLITEHRHIKHAKQVALDRVFLFLNAAAEFVKFFWVHSGTITFPLTLCKHVVISGAVDKQDVFQCRNARDGGTCPKSDAVVLQEDAMYLQMGCRTCRSGWVITMPEGKAKAALERRRDEIKKREEARRAAEARPTYFT